MEKEWLEENRCQGHRRQNKEQQTCQIRAGQEPRCIPFMEFNAYFNPGHLFKFYVSHDFMPDEATKKGLVGGFLFPKSQHHAQKRSDLFMKSKSKSLKNIINFNLIYFSL